MWKYLSNLQNFNSIEEEPFDEVSDDEEELFEKEVDPRATSFFFNRVTC
jgi:hypothetical protein